MTGEITMFSAPAHPAFAQEMCDILGVELGIEDHTVQQRCLQVQLKATAAPRRVRGADLATPVQDNLFELLLMLDAARARRPPRWLRHPALRVRPV